MKKFIDVSKKTRDFLGKTFGVTERMVLYSLSYDERNGQSETARRIRSLAMQKGGIVYVTSPESETIHDADGYMRQYFGNGAMLEVNKESGWTSLYVSGRKKQVWCNPTLKEYAVIQSFAENNVIGGILIQTVPPFANRED